jgi:hypothetical protein
VAPRKLQQIIHRLRYPLNPARIEKIHDQPPWIDHHVFGTPEMLIPRILETPTDEECPTLEFRLFRKKIRTAESTE